MNTQRHKGFAAQGRDGYAILGALRARGLNFVRVAQAAGVSAQLTQETAHGKRNNRKVLRCMLEFGLDAEILRLPDDLRGVAA